MEHDKIIMKYAAGSESAVCIILTRSRPAWFFLIQGKCGRQLEVA